MIKKIIGILLLCSPLYVSICLGYLFGGKEIAIYMIGAVFLAFLISLILGAVFFGIDMLLEDK
ncbi:MAG: hypothetical protein KKA19_09605 [Candidatus Margulisbacteria bacterium]|nr:hypothetical protein [Candidatus Margulisiibacteriota bacterium]